MNIFQIAELSETGGLSQEKHFWGALAGAVAGPVVNKLLGGSKPSYGGGGAQNIHTTSEVLIPDYLKSKITGLANRANEFYTQPYTPYTDTRIAPFEADQLAAFQGIRDLQGQYQPLIDQASGLTQQLAQRVGQGFVTPDRISALMSPYQQGVTDIAKRETLRDYAKELNRISDYASSMDAFGGSRHAILEAEAGRNVGQRLSDLQTQGLQSGYDRATQLALQSGIAETQGLSGAAGQMANLAGMGQQYGLQGLAALQGIGGQQQAMNQSLLDFAYQQFAEQRNYPAQQMAGLSSILYPLLGQSGTSTGQTTSYQPGLSNINAALGGAAIGQSLGPAFGAGLNSFFNGTGYGTGVDVYNSVNNPANSAFFSEGGPVGLKKFASGGSVGGPYGALKSIEDYLETFKYQPKAGDTIGERFLGGLANTPVEMLRKPLQAITGASEMIGSGVTSGAKTIQDFLSMTPEELQAGIALGKEDTAKKTSMQPKEVAPIPEPVPILMDSLDTIREKEGLPRMTPKETPKETSKKEAPKEKSFYDKIDLPMLAMGAKILQSGNMSPLSALGGGIDTLMGTKAAMNKAALEAKQQQFENLMSQMNAETNRINADVSKQRAKFEKEKQPFEIDKLKAQAEQAEMEMNIKKALGPYAVTVLGLLKNDPMFSLQTPEQQQAQIQNMVDLVKSISQYGPAGTTQGGLPEGVTPEMIKEAAQKYGMSEQEVIDYINNQMSSQ